MKKILKHLRKEWYRYGLDTLVVVVGVLIAFSLSNWNEGQKKKIDRNKYLISLRNDLVRDTLLLTRIIDITTEEYNLSSNLDKRIHGIQTTYDSVVNIAKEFVLNTEAVDGIDAYHTSTYDVLESTGKFVLFDDELSSRIFDNYRLQEQIIVNQSTLQNSFYDRIGLYLRKYRYNARVEDGYVYNLAWRIENEREFVIAFADLNGLRTFLMSHYLEGYRKLLQNTRDLLSIIDEFEK